MKNFFRRILKKILEKVAVYFKTEEPGVSGFSEEILYFISGGLGDLILAAPAVSMLYEAASGSSKIYVSVSKKNLNAARFIYGEISAEISVKTKWGMLLKLFIGRKKRSALSNVISVFRPSVELISFISSSYSAGFRYEEEKPQKKCYSRVLPVNKKRHDVLQNLDLLNLLYPHSAGNKQSDISDVEPFHIGFKDGGYYSGEKTVIIHPGVGRGAEERLWPFQRFIQAAEKLEEKGYSTVFLLGPDDESLENKLNGRKIFKGLSLDEVFQKISRCSLFIGNDSGPAHLAAASGANVIVLFGSADPKRSAPHSERCRIIYKGAECAPCHYSEKKQECRGQCMLSITVDEVSKTALELLEKS